MNLIRRFFVGRELDLKQFVFAETNGIGQNLAGVFGEGVAQGRGGFAFSDALKGKGGVFGLFSGKRPQ